MNSGGVAAPRALPPGTTVAGFRIDGVLGWGAMGTVYEATQLSLDRKVALKLIAPERGESDALRRRFRLERLRQAALDNPHIVPVYEAGETEHGLYFAMRLVRGPTLGDLIVAGRLDAARAVRILSQVADALDAAHDHGLIHRDVKPHNILVEAADHAYLADFGLTKAVDDRNVTQSGTFVGTLNYVAPEQIRGEQVTGRADVYALAAVLFECLTGVVPYREDSQAALLWAHLASAVPRVSAHRPDLPAALDTVIARGMAKQPEARFATAGALLRSAAESLGGHGGVPTSSSEASAAAGRVARVDASTVADEPASAGPLAATGAPSSRPSRRALAAVALALAAVAAAVGGYASGASGRDEHAPAKRLAAGPLRIDTPHGWRRVASVPRVPGLKLSSPVAATGGKGRRLIVGMADGSGATLLPRALLDRLPRPPRRDDAVALGSLVAYRYRGLRPRGSLPLTVFVVPTAKAVATVACPGKGRQVECERAAATLRLEGVRALALGARDDYAKALNATLARLDAARRHGRSALRSAAARGARARAARSLSRAFARVAADLSTAPVGPAERPAHEALRDDARAAEAAYLRLASAARRGSVDAFGSAASSVRRRESAFERDLRALAGLGYAVR